MTKLLRINLILLFATFSNLTHAEDISDPIEPFNRGMFAFNNVLDEYFFEPVATGYDYVVPNSAQNSVSNFFINLNSPVYLVSDILQLKFGQALTHTERFVINTTIGLLGLFDVAKEFGLEHHREDIGSAFGYWGARPGFYLVLPILGPSSLRDGIGLVGDSFLSPTTAVGFSNLNSDTKLMILGGSNALQFVNIRSSLLEPIRSAKEASVDYYSFVKNSYQQRRQGIIYDGNPPEEEYIEQE